MSLEQQEKKLQLEKGTKGILMTMVMFFFITLATSRSISFFALSLYCVPQGLCTINYCKNVEQRNQVIVKYLQHDSIMMFKSR